MKVFNLACEHEHQFEGWFGSVDEYERQLTHGMIECPMCGSKTIRKLLAAPRLNLSGAHEPPPERPSAKPTSPAEQAHAIWMKVARHIADHTEDVGERFSDEARRIHYAEAPRRGIRGVASAEQAAELADEGIEVFAFPFPKALKEPLQ
ncbi:MAG: DUF1178 family protein [Burkholderiaceae bacterium]